MSKWNKLGLDNATVKSKKKGITEDTTETGEFICSFDNWMTLEEQKQNAEYLANIERLDREKKEEERFRPN